MVIHSDIVRKLIYACASLRDKCIPNKLCKIIFHYLFMTLSELLDFTVKLTFIHGGSEKLGPLLPVFALPSLSCG